MQKNYNTHHIATLSAVALLPSHACDWYSAKNLGKFPDKDSAVVHVEGQFSI